jgi:hypothetical protein
MFGIDGRGPGKGSGFLGMVIMWGGWPTCGGILKELTVGSNEMLGNEFETGAAEGTDGALAWGAESQGHYVTGNELKQVVKW